MNFLWYFDINVERNTCMCLKSIFAENVSVHVHLHVSCKFTSYLQFHSEEFVPGRKLTLRGELQAGVSQGTCSHCFYCFEKTRLSTLNLPCN